MNPDTIQLIGVLAMPSVFGGFFVFAIIHSQLRQRRERKEER